MYDYYFLEENMTIYETICDIIEKQEFLKRMLTRGCLIGPHENDTYNVLIL